MKKRIPFILDMLIYIGWTGIGLVNFVFVLIHASPVNVAGLFTGAASVSFTFMAASAFIMLPVSAIALYLALRRRELIERMRKNIVWRMARAALTVFGAFFIIVQAMMVAASLPKDIPATPEIIILGAHVSRQGPSATLLSRLEAGAEYAAANPDMRIVVSGGQGLDEPVTEASAMSDYLISKGISADRILLEDRSSNTFENLNFSRPLLPEGEGPYPITIVTSEFHILRTSMLAVRAGYTPYFIPARTPRSILLSSYSREFFGLIKSFLTDR